MLEQTRQIRRPADLLWRLLEDAVNRAATEVSVETYGGGLCNLKVYHNGRSEHVFSLPSMLHEREGKPGLLADIAPYCLIDMQTGREAQTESGAMHAVHGRIAKLEQQSCRVGMEISVTNLYFNLPEMYRKYRTASREKRYCMEVVRQFYMCYGLSVRWLESSAPETHLPALARFADRVEQLYPGAFTDHARLSLHGGTLYLLQGPQYVSNKYGICALRAGALMPSSTLLEAYTAACAGFGQDADVPCAILMLDGVASPQAEQLMASEIADKLPTLLTANIPRRSVRRASPTPKTRKISLPVFTAEANMPQGGRLADCAGYAVFADAGALFIADPATGKALRIPFAELEKHLKVTR